MPQSDPIARAEYHRQYESRPEVIARRRARSAARDPEEKRAYRRAWAEQNRDKKTASSRRINAKKREIVLRKKEKGCADCGERDVRVIQLHATQGHTVRGKCIGDGSRFSYAALEAELSICEPLCANCHIRRHA